MHNSELFGRTIRCNYAQPPKIKGGDAGFATQPVWADADAYAAERDAEEERDDAADESDERRDANVD
jgi:peptidyl-prolyl isomerase E (cyclophilin E)